MGSVKLGPSPAVDPGQQAASPWPQASWPSGKGTLEKSHQALTASLTAAGAFSLGGRFPSSSHFSHGFRKQTDSLVFISWVGLQPHGKRPVGRASCRSAGRDRRKGGRVPRPRSASARPSSDPR